MPLLAGYQRHIECWIGSFMILWGSGPVLLRNPIFFVIFQGGPDPLFPPSGSAHVQMI